MKPCRMPPAPSSLQQQQGASLPSHLHWKQAAASFLLPPTQTQTDNAGRCQSRQAGSVNNTTPAEKGISHTLDTWVKEERRCGLLPSDTWSNNCCSTSHTLAHYGVANASPLGQGCPSSVHTRVSALHAAQHAWPRHVAPTGSPRECTFSTSGSMHATVWRRSRAECNRLPLLGVGPAAAAAPPLPGH